MNIYLTQEIPHYQYLRERLKAEFPDADEETLQDTLEGLSNLTEMIAAVLRSRLDDLDLAKALRERIAEMQARLGRLQYRAEKKRDLVTSVMERAEIRKITEPDFTVSLRPTPPALVVLAEDEIPEDYWRPQPAKLDRQGLLTALRTGEAIPGARLGNGSVTISVRTK